MTPKKVLSDDEVINKLSKKCDEECELEKNKSFEIIGQLASELDRQAEESKTNYLAFKESTSFSSPMNIFLSESHGTNDDIVRQIDNDSEEVINKEYVEQKENDENLSSSTTPAISNEIGLFTNQEFLRRQHLATETEKVRDKVKTELTTIKNGIRSMDKVDIVVKTSTVLGKVLAEVKIFVSGDPLEVMIGAVKIVNAIKNFFPPPASVISRHVTNILGTFVDIVKMELQKWQIAVDEHKRILSATVEDYSKMKSLENKDVKEFLQNEEFYGALNHIKAQIDAFDFLNTDHDYQKDKGIAQDIKFLLETDKILEIKEHLEKICFDTGLMKVNQTLIRNQFCTDLLHTYISLNQLRDLILASFVNKGYRSGLALHVLDVDKRRQADLKKWLEDKIVKNDSLSCPLFITKKQFWTDPVKELTVKNYIQNIDNNFLAALNRLDAEHCEHVEQDNLRQYCNCNDVGSHSMICDLHSQCSCKDYYRGKTCEIGESGINLIFC